MFKVRMPQASDVALRISCLSSTVSYVSPLLPTWGFSLFQALLESAFRDYEKQTGKTLTKSSTRREAPELGLNRVRYPLSSSTDRNLQQNTGEGQGPKTIQECLIGSRSRVIE